MKSIIETNRLVLKSLKLDDFSFIKNLVNTEGWIKFIGDRNIKTDDDAENYIKKILDNNAVKYWIVNLKDNNIPIGIITFIKRDYLEFHDLGFAFLPDFQKNGYAFEASTRVIQELISKQLYPIILATTIPENIKSIELLVKLGFEFKESIKNNDESLSVYLKKM